MEGLVDSNTKSNANLRELLERMCQADTEQDAIDIARQHALDISPVMLFNEIMRMHPKLIQGLKLTTKDITCTDLMVEIASIIHTGHQEEDDDEEEEEEEEEDDSFVVSDDEVEHVKRKFEEDDEEEEEPIGASARKYIRAMKDLKPVRQDKPLLSALFTLEQDPEATLDQLWPIVNALLPLCKKWPRPFQKIFRKIQDE